MRLLDELHLAYPSYDKRSSHGAARLRLKKSWRPELRTDVRLLMPCGSSLLIAHLPAAVARMSAIPGTYRSGIPYLLRTAWRLTGRTRRCSAEGMDLRPCFERLEYLPESPMMQLKPWSGVLSWRLSTTHGQCLLHRGVDVVLRSENDRRSSIRKWARSSPASRPPIGSRQLGATSCSTDGSAAAYLRPTHSVAGRVGSRNTLAAGIGRSGISGWFPCDHCPFKGFSRTRY